MTESTDGAVVLRGSNQSVALALRLAVDLIERTDGDEWIRLFGSLMPQDYQGRPPYKTPDDLRRALADGEALRRIQREAINGTV